MTHRMVDFDTVGGKTIDRQSQWIAMCSNDEILWSISPPERLPNGKFEWETCLPLPLFVIFPRLSWGFRCKTHAGCPTAPGHDEAGRAKSFCGSNQPGQWKACLWMVGIMENHGHVQHWIYSICSLWPLLGGM